ncbi:MAG: methyltransferase domain-containing protein [Candidatus Pacebacteria bacterium]|nr:methyltransferase domain-containing protein [Candidatus Paceibacterota bacterium]
MKHNISWKKYIKKRESNPPRPLLVEAVEYVEKKDTAFDLGSGTMNDTRFLLKHFKNVIAIDSDASSKERAEKIENKNLEFVFDDFEKVPFPKCDLINAQFVLPYSEDFNSLFQKISTSLKQGGIFTGQLFGDKDSWNTGNDFRVYHTKNEVEDLFSKFKIIKLVEEEKDKESALGVPKHSHIFHFIVRKT